MKGNFSLPKIAIFGLLAVSLVGIFGTVMFIQQQQETRSRASYGPTPTKAAYITPTKSYSPSPKPTIDPCITTQGNYNPGGGYPSPTKSPTTYPTPTYYPCPTATPTPTIPPNNPTPTICPTLSPVKNVRIECPNCQ